MAIVGAFAASVSFRCRPSSFRRNPVWVRRGIDEILSSRIEEQLQKAQEEAAELRAKAVAAYAEDYRLWQSSNAANARVDEILEMLSAAQKEANNLRQQSAVATELARKAKDQGFLAQEKVRELLAAKSK